MHLLVTGGEGFIGSNFIRLALQAHPDYTIVNLDKETYAGKGRNLEEVTHENYRQCTGDICDAKLVA